MEMETDGVENGDGVVDGDGVVGAFDDNYDSGDMMLILQELYNNPK